MEELKRSSWNPMWTPPSRGGELLLRPGAGPGRLGVPKGAPFFCAPRAAPGTQSKSIVAENTIDGGGETSMPAIERAMFIIDAELRIELRNACAVSILARRDLVIEHRGTLCCRQEENDRRLRMALREITTAAQTAASSGNGLADRRSAVLRRGDEGGFAIAILHGLHEGRDRRVNRVLLTLLEPRAQPALDMEVLASAFRLTPAEARLAALIACGSTTAKCGRALGIQTSTLRSHLSAIYRKTGTHGKADLVRVVLSLCAI